MHSILSYLKHGGIVLKKQGKILIVSISPVLWKRVGSEWTYRWVTASPGPAQKLCKGCFDIWAFSFKKRSWKKKKDRNELKLERKRERLLEKMPSIRPQRQCDASICSSKCNAYWFNTIFEWKAQSLQPACYYDMRFYLSTAFYVL